MDEISDVCVAVPSVTHISADPPTSESAAMAKPPNEVNRLRALSNSNAICALPLAPVVDVRMTINFVDAYTFIIEWGRTKIDVVENNLAGAQEIYAKLLGVVLNKADIQVLSRYEGYQSPYYYNKKYYGRYIHTE